MKYKFTLPFSLLCWILFSLNCSAASAAEELYQHALTNYQKGKLQTAIEDLQELINRGNSSYESEARWLLASSYLHLHEYDRANATAAELIYRFPQSRYVAHAYYIQAEVAFLHADFFECVWQLLMVAQFTQEHDLRQLAVKRLLGISGNYLDAEQQQELLGWVESSELKAELQAVNQGITLPVKIGVILDLSGPNGSAGEKILSGIESAVDECKQKIKRELQIVTRDSRGNVAEAILSAQTLIREERVIAIIGDYNGVCSAAIAAVAAAAGIPQIVPTSQDIDLTLIGAHIFQMLPDYHLEGEIAAAYTLKNLQLQRVAILAPASDAGIQRVEGFKSRFEALGGKIAGLQWYYQGATNYRRQLDALLNPTCAVSQGAENNAIQTDGNSTDTLAQGEVVDSSSIFSLLNPIIEPESNGYIDALYIPVQGEEISILAPQVAASGFTGQLIGSGNCIDAITPDSDWRYVDGIVFASAFQYPQALTIRPDFLQKYGNNSGEERDRWVQIGRNAFNLLAVALAESDRMEAADVSNRLQQTRHLRTDRTELYFPESSRINHALFMIEFGEGHFQTLKTPAELNKIKP